MPSTGTLVFNDQKLQAPEMYATESLGVGVSVPTSNLEVVGNAYVSSNLDVGGSLGLTKGSSLFVGDSVMMETSKHDRPIVKYPEIAMTASTVGGYTVSEPTNTFHSNSAYRIHQAFDDSEASHWETFGGSYDTSTRDPQTSGSYVVTTVASGTTYYGIYAQMLAPIGVKVSHVDIRPQNTYGLERLPGIAVFVGSNDGTTWTLIRSVTNNSGALNTYTRYNVNATQAYRYIRIIWNKLTTVGTNTSYRNRAAASEIKIFGTEEGDVSTDVTLSSVYNKPGTEHLEVYYDGQDYTSMPSSVTDKSGNSVTGTPSGVSFDSTWKAFSFDGVNDYIRGTISGVTGDYIHSVSLWIKLTGTNDVIFEISGATRAANSIIGLYVDADGTLAYYFYDNDARYNTNLQIGQWYHVGLTYHGGGERRVYVNGVQATFKTSYGTLTNSLTLAGGTLTIGNMINLAGNYFNGSIANFRLFSKALNAEQVKELYDYQKDYFLGSRSSLTIHKGNLGLGVAEPTSHLEIAGNERLQEYPPRAMTGHDTYMEGHGVFKARWANWYAGNTPTGMYNKQNAVGGQENIWYGPYNGQTGGNGNAYNGGDVYSGTDFAASTTSGFYLDDVNGNRYHGAWTTLEMPYDILLQRIHLYQGANSEGISSRCITEDGVILGSANGHEWHHVHTFTGLQYGGTLGSYSFDAAGESVTVNATTPYKHYALVTTRTLHYAFTVIIGELIWFGTPAPTTLDDGHLTLGKTLTTPRVSGHAAGAETPRAESLVIHYDTTVDSVASGSAALDTSGLGNSGTFNGNAAYSSSDRSFSFDGSGDYIVTTGVPTASGSGNFTHTVSMWFRLDAMGGTNRMLWGLVGENDGTDGTPSSYGAPHALVDTSGNISWAMWGNDIYTQASGIVANRWYHCVWTYSGGTTGRRMFLDGVEQTFNAAQTAALNMRNSTSRLAIGIYPHNLSANPLDGQISNFKMWNVALTEDEVAREYALGRTGKALNVTDTAVCLGGSAPRAQLDVRGSARFDGYIETNGLLLTKPEYSVTFNNTSTAGTTYEAIPINTLTNNATYFVTLRWGPTGHPYTPWEAKATTLLNVITTNTNYDYGADWIALNTATHDANAGNFTIYVRTRGGSSSSRAGLSYKVASSYAPGDWTIEAYRIM